MSKIKDFFFPPANSPRWMYILPIATLVILVLIVVYAGIHGWEYSNSPTFCGTTCHTMPPQHATYLESPHANVTCEECHIGRASFQDQLMRKSQGLKEAYYTIFNLYTLPINAKALQPARDTCETCHLPEQFSDDSLRVINRYQDDPENTLTNTYLVLKTGGGDKREGLGRGIHWHVANKVEYYATDELSQMIPYVRVNNDDGTTTEYIDVESGFDPGTIDENQLEEMDCTTCHNRVSHNFKPPRDSMDDYMSRGLIDPGIPEIHKKGVEILSAKYATQQEGLDAIAGLEAYYQQNHADYYSGNSDMVKAGIAEIQKIYETTVFLDQKVDWTTHPNNLGHIDSPGCFRCHDGKHLNQAQEAIRLECNLCHSIPKVAGEQDFVTNIEISRGPEPESHLNPNWISLHNQMFDGTCASCHTTENAGTTANTSFCSNSACHGSAYTYAGFDAPKLREILKDQLPPPVPTPTPAPTPAANATLEFGVNIAPLFVKCAACHNSTTLTGGLDLGSYESLMKGGKSGAVVTPGDATGSLLVQIQSGKHFTNLSPAELAIIEQWINAGAEGPQITEPSPAPPSTTAANLTYEYSIAPLLAARCTMCHQGENAPDGLDMTTFTSLMKGNKDGAVIVPGDSADSELIEVQSGKHFANFTSEELELFKQWIDAGAIEK
jgi:NapC/NirT cytochrome c family, N-terminal region/Planctomycete cytochrome C